ncbi:MAG TPA: DinB family protein [Nitrospirae bacterium]|nr:DinB family protein [Nitrospirota bacterium]
MSVLDPYYMRNGKVVEGLASAVEQIPDDKILWTPCEKSIPWIRLIDHTGIAMRHLILKALKEEPLDVPACFFDESNCAKTPKDAAKALRDAWQELKSFLESQPEDFPKKEVAFTKGRKMTVEQAVWFNYEHNVHHRGQAWIYARMNGITPPAIWGSEQPD